jgi:Methyltransferase domain
MKRGVRNPSRSGLTIVLALLLVAPGVSLAQEKPFEPVVGQAGKDVVWVPTPAALVDKMLEMAEVTAKDIVMDLGSGDGRNIIAAARRGARALGVEYNIDMVELSRRTAAKEGVADKAKFVQGDMFEADISQATVLALFLLPHNLYRLRPKFLALAPGTRIVLNGFPIEGWEPDQTGRVQGDCGSWCTWHLYLVPAKVAGTWRLPQGTLRLEQKFQALSGALSVRGASTPITNARLSGERISFTAGMTEYAGRVKGDTMSGEVKGASSGFWSATRARP